MGVLLAKKPPQRKVEGHSTGDAPANPDIRTHGGNQLNRNADADPFARRWPKPIGKSNHGHVGLTAQTVGGREFQENQLHANVNDGYGEAPEQQRFGQVAPGLVNF